jgi:hypothetical protein
MVFEESGQIVSIRWSVEKLVFSSFSNKEAAHCVEVAEIQCQNHSLTPWVWVWKNVTVVALSQFVATQDHRSESPDFSQRLSPQTRDLHRFFLPLNLEETELNTCINE